MELKTLLIYKTEQVKQTYIRDLNVFARVSRGNICTVIIKAIGLKRSGNQFSYLILALTFTIYCA